MSKKLIFDIILSPISLIVGDKVGHIISGIGITAIGILSGNPLLVSLGLGMLSGAMGGKPKGLSDPNGNRLTATLVPTDPRKIWFGHTAGAADVRYQAFTGSKQEYLEMIVCHASHEVHSIDELWLDNELAWNGSVQGRYVGYLDVTPITLGTNANGIAIDGNWTVNSTLTGCAYSHLKFKLTGNSDKVSSPFSSGVTSRMTFRGKGAKVYDPRLDSTVDGGSGSHRADDQTTWAWDDDASRNPALQELFYELGWKINDKLAVGKGVPPARIDLASYAVAANANDESVALNGGGTEPRYRSDGVVSEGDDPGAVRDNLCTTMNAVLRDAGGKLSLTVIANDLASPVLPSGKSAFDENDIMGEMQWDQTPDLHQSFNIVLGRRIDPSDQALYQPVDFPEVSLASNDGIDRINRVDYPFVQSNGQSQRLAKQFLERNQYQGRLTFTGKPSFWGINIGDVFPLTHAAFGWSAKLFRCAGQTISRTGETQIIAVEENAAIYAWDNDESPAVTPGTPVVYDPTNHPIVQGIGDAFSRWIEDPPQSLVFHYDYTGTAESGEFSRTLTFKLNDSAGQITSGITWTYLVLTGTVNTFTNASGAKSISGAGTGTMTVSSLGSSSASVQITAVYGGKTYVKTIVLSQDIALPPVDSGGGGGGGGGVTTIASKSSGFSDITSSTFVDLSGAITTAAIPAGKTTADITVQLNATPDSGNPTSSWTVELKVMRDITGTPTQVGTTQSANSSWDASDFSGTAARFNFTINDTSLTAGVSYVYRIYGRLTAGTDTHHVTGDVWVTS